MGKPRDAFGLELHEGDIVAAVATRDVQLLGTSGVVVRSSCENLIGVQLERRLLSSSAHPEVLFTAPTVWGMTTRGQGIDA